jgi:hypothetical protein
MGWHATIGLEEGIAATYRDFVAKYATADAAPPEVAQADAAATVAPQSQPSSTPAAALQA